ncbi:MAG: 4-hydroxy-tetrahydrodipicolinate reductase [Endomicrobium sp.]|jgi:4-hydroxy-tetrahydrodipicolinate reductase|nr:4-hydroxy-tetrahydrodipicolinate reductase [Endomicrobium sp.]
MKIAVCGAAGRMGQAIIGVAKVDGGVEIGGAFEYAGNPVVGQTICGIVIDSVRNLDAEISKSDVLIDFTSPESALSNLETASKRKIPAVIGTTGFTLEQKEKIAQISKIIPVVLSPNMSVGVNLLFKLVEEAAKAMPDYDIEIVELHHNKKKDAPSGTAAKLAECAALARGKNIGEAAVYARHGVIGERKKDEIGVMSVRAGDIVGDHTVYFAGPGETIELTHRAHSRDTFAAGAVRAAKWLYGKSAGLYSMKDVLTAIEN